MKRPRAMQQTFLAARAGLSNWLLMLSFYALPKAIRSEMVEDFAKLARANYSLAAVMIISRSQPKG